MARFPQDAAEAWRRHIYVEGLYAAPMGGFLAKRKPLSALHKCYQGSLYMSKTVKADAQQRCRTAPSPVTCTTPTAKLIIMHEGCMHLCHKARWW